MTYGSCSCCNPCYTSCCKPKSFCVSKPDTSTNWAGTYSIARTANTETANTETALLYTVSTLALTAVVTLLTGNSYSIVFTYNGDTFNAAALAFKDRDGNPYLGVNVVDITGTSLDEVRASCVSSTNKTTSAFGTFTVSNHDESFWTFVNAVGYDKWTRTA